ncbi:MAG: hypothetical protein HYX54_00675 [Chloroflexi bacterium]|nr:hypothetical protein [Chloroflexota bacterium]
MGAPLPSAPLRLLRRRTALVAVAAVATMAIAASQVATAARVRLSEEIDANWRGAYDVLVRPAGARLDLESTNGLVEPNFVALAGQGGISAAQVATIRAIPGVEIAAPIAWVGFVTTRVASPTIEIPKVPSKPTLYSATLTVATSDGVSRRLVYEDTLRILLAPEEKNFQGCPTVISDNVGSAGCGTSPDGRWTLEVSSLHYPPQLQSPILAVDPDAERALLGASGAFLDPLVKLPNSDGLTVGTVDEKRIILPNFEDWRGDIGFLKSRPFANVVTLSRPVIPILVSAKSYDQIQVSLEVSQIGQPLATLPDTDRPAAMVLDDAAREAGPGTTAVGTSTVQNDKAGAFRVFGLRVPWPGSSVPWGLGEGGLIGNRTIVAALTGRPTYIVAAAQNGTATPAFRIVPQGTVPPGGPGSELPVPGPRVRLGSEQSYRPLETVSPPLVEAFKRQNTMDRPFFLAPIGEYDLDTLKLPDNPLSYVPYGAYDPPDTTLVAGPDGRPVTPAAMNPTLNPTGLLQAPPMGIVDIRAAELLRGPAPIDAIRVRVGGITGYDPAAVATVERVAGAIAELGLTVEVVAASSPQAVDIYVPAYDTSSDLPRDLGWVRQRWTTLGAAPRVERALGETNLALLLLALLAVTVIVAGTALLSATARAREAAILAAIGWRRSTIVRWQASESAVAGAIVLALGFAGWVVSAREPLGLALALYAGTAFIVSGLAAAVLVRPSARRLAAGDVVVPHRRLSPFVGGLRTYGLRSLLARPWRSLTIMIGLALAAATIAPGLVVLTSVGSRVGPTLLASVLAERLAAYQLALLALIGLGTLAFTLLALRLDLAARQAELRVLQASGWTRGDIARMLAWTRFGIALPAALLAAGLASLTAAAIAGPDVPVGWIAALAGGLALSALLWGRLASLRLSGGHDA